MNPGYAVVRNWRRGEAALHLAAKRQGRDAGATQSPRTGRRQSLAATMSEPRFSQAEALEDALHVLVHGAGLVRGMMAVSALVSVLWSDCRVP